MKLTQMFIFLLGINKENSSSYEVIFHCLRGEFQNVDFLGDIANYQSFWSDTGRGYPTV